MDHKSNILKTENHLAGQSSPYLLQHLYNPVDWFPWGEEARQKAVEENKPLLISIGYSACHWCHVMERESFEDEEVAALMNENFVCIKVDREERPDVDHLYMNAVQIISGQGGWPLNCFAMPDGRPFWGATYFPKNQWKKILLQIANLYKSQYSDLEEQAQRVAEGLNGNVIISKEDENSETFESATTKKMAEDILSNIDKAEGGTRGAPKFPLPVIYEFLLHYYSQTKNQDALNAVELTLKKMAMGGIYDQIGGGFARYSTDDKWKIPHFEKMLYDNAQLISLYSKAWKINPEEIYREVVYDTIEFVSRELTSGQGAFFAALDADSEGEEGKYYVWKEKELDEIFQQEAGLVKKYYNMGGLGFWEKGNNILLRNKTDDDFAQESGIEPSELKQKIRKWKEKLLNERQKRISPGLDNKVLVSWNGLMINGLIEAYKAFGDNDFLQKAEKAANFILNHALTIDGKIYHTLHCERPEIDGFLEDYSSMIQALVGLYQATLKENYLLKANKIVKYVLQYFTSEKTSLFSFSSTLGEKLAAPYFEYQDNVIPASNSIMACNLFYLGNYFENHDYIARSRRMLTDMKPHLEKYGSWAANWGILWLHHQKDFYTLAVCGPEALETIAQINHKFFPDTLIAGTTKNERTVPLLENRFVENENLIYPCTLESCRQPMKTVDELFEFLQK